MKEPLTLDEAGPETESREELLWKIQSLEDHVAQLVEENRTLAKGNKKTVSAVPAKEVRTDRIRKYCSLIG